MNTILITLYVPALAQQFELFIPEDVPLAELMPVIVDGIYTMSSYRYKSSGEELLCREETGLLKQRELTAREYHIRNGEHLVLI